MNGEIPRFAIAFSGEVPEGGLVRIPVATVGKWFKGKMRAAVTRADLAKLVANFRKRLTGEVVIDYDHGTEYAAGSGQAVPAAGWLKEIEDAPDQDGVLYGRAEFTDKAAGMLRAKEYKYISPVIVWGARDPKTGDQQGATLTSIALTNSPLMQELPAIAFSDVGWKIDRGDAGDGSGKEQKRVTKVIMADRVAGTVRLVADDGTENVVRLEGLEAQPVVIRFSDLERGSDGKLDFTSLAQEKDALIASDVLAAMQAQTELDAAVTKGLITPAQRPFYERMAFSDLSGFRSLVATMKPVVDLKEYGLGGDGGEMTELQKVEAQLSQKVRERQKEQPTLQYHEALKLVASENPDLDRRRTLLIREGGNR